MELQELFAKMQSGEVTMHTELGTRDEKKQSRQFVERFTKQKTVTGINNRILVMKDVVLPFNPLTCEEDDIYNAKSPFRPILLVSQVLTLIKNACAQDPKLAEAWERKLGGKFDEGEPTLHDYLMMRKAEFIKPRIHTYHTVSIQLPQEFGGQKFKTRHTVDSSQLNESGTYDMDNQPVHHQLALLFNALVKPAWDSARKKMEAAGATKEQLSTRRRDMYADVPIGFVSPTNLIPFFAFPLDEMPPVMKPEDFMQVEKYIRFYSYTEKWTNALNKVLKEPQLDEDIDFYDFTMVTPSSDDRKANGQVYTDQDTTDIYQALTITNTDGRRALHGGNSYDGETAVPNEQAFASVIAAIKNYFIYSQGESAKPDGDTFEKIMAASNRFRPILAVYDKLIPACKMIFETKFKDNPYNTVEFRAAHSAILAAMDKKYALELAGLDDEEIQAAEEKAQASVKDIISESHAAEGVNVANDGIGVVEMDLS